MNRQPTPWAHAVTSSPETFSAILRQQILVIEAGSRSRALCRLDLGTKRITQMAQGPGTDVPVVPYRVVLQPWNTQAPPIVDAHPFLLLHLLVTEQVNRDELLEMVSGINKGTSRITLSVRRPCDLLRMAQQRQIALRLMTNNNLGWRYAA